MGHQKKHIDVDGGDAAAAAAGGQGSRPVTGMMPRALVAKAAAAGDERPKSNADFKAMLQKPPAAQ